MQIAHDKVVAFHYTLTNQAGDTLDSSHQREEPLTYLHGYGNIIPGLESALAGKETGDKLDVTVAPEDGYGERNDGLVQQVPISAFEGAESTLQPGMQFQAQTEAGPRIFTITAVEGEDITVDGNHPLAGETLSFSVEITDVRDATDEEQQHGHAHGPGGHEH